ncbi:molybdenum cofactor biosynthesis protein B [Mycobacteroides abscessus subsp. abscessus]|nr:molybdenum cofactor biosynthesis protein B [Mycobacteroides abscessus subsp. abscessus]
MKQELFIGKDGQRNIENSHAVILGAGALGSAVSEMLVRAGIGKLTIIDRDYVEQSNLQRQQLYTEEDAAKKLPKAIAAKKRLKEISGYTLIESIVEDINYQTIEKFIHGASILIDGTDNFETRLVINDAAIKHQIPFIFGACVGSYGLSYPVVGGNVPCLHCLIDKLPSQQVTCDTAGVISPIVQWVAAMQVSQAMQILSGKTILPVLRSFDIWKMEYVEMNVAKLRNNSCPTCGIEADFPYLSFRNQTKVAVLCGRDAVHIRPPMSKELDLYELSQQWKSLVVHLTANPYLLSFHYDAYRVILFKDGRAIIHGTSEESVAKSIYAKLIG